MIDDLFLQVVGGVFLLLYGVRLTGQGFELAFGAKLSRLWTGPDGGRLRAFGAGALSTSLIQSSGAVVAMVISFAEIAPLPLSQSLAVVLGADLGSTVTVQILSFRIYQYAFLVVSAGVILFLWGRKRNLRAIGQGVLGFGILLLALKILSEAASEIGSITSLRLLMADLAYAPVVAFIWGVMLSALFQSGTAVMILLIAFTQQGVLPLSAVLPLVLGANVGGTSLAFTASSGLAAEGRRIAWGHLLMKTVGAVLFLPFFSTAQGFLSFLSPDPSRIVANAHTMFNFTLGLLFFPLVPRLATGLSRAVPGKAPTAPVWKPVYLDREHLPAVGAALGQVAREIVRMADMIQEMQEMALQAVRGVEGNLAARIAKADDDVDRLTREVKIFLSALGEGALTPEQTRRAVAYISIVSDLENIGDFIDKTLGEHVRKLAERGQRFSEEGAQELESLMREVESMYGEAVSAFVTRDVKAAEIVISRKRAIGQMERQLRIAHIHRLQKGTPESLESSAAHLDILSSWKVIASHCASIAYNIVQMDG
ncbi:MAG TPA: Na/Pi cotransporter family protein [Candidatus Deferrimicrobiaceae bacterium]|nr:Na/Pi cotransporter family protein [Candidatus Deferrimicrobiaceae bacterium]